MAPPKNYFVLESPGQPEWVPVDTFQIGVAYTFLARISGMGDWVPTPRAALVQGQDKVLTLDVGILPVQWREITWNGGA